MEYNITKTKNTNNKLINAQKAKEDEYYTIYEQFEILLKEYLLHQLKDKIIYCPCDSDWSNIVKVLKDYKNILQYKELIYTSDDFRTHDDLFEKCDIIITNPPFSLAAEWYNMLFKHNCKFFVYGYMTNVFQNYLADKIISNKVNYIVILNDPKLDFAYEPARGKIEGAESHKNDIRLAHLFKRPNGNYTHVNAYIYYNIELDKEPKYRTEFELTKTLKDVEYKFGYLDNTKILDVKNYLEFPKDYYGIAAISPVRYTKWKSKLEVVCYDICGNLCKQNNKNLFKRWFVRQIGSNAELKDYININKNKLF